MHPLYEHVHEDGDPIEDSAGATNNLSWPTRAGEEKSTLIYGHRITTDMSRSLRGTKRTLDPLVQLPPELSTFVIAQALPQHNIDIDSLPSPYPSRLIELTTVSKKWQGFLFSTPVLWSELCIDERQEDVLATLSVFVTLSSNAPVKLFLCGKPIGIDWTAVGSTLLPAAERVTRLEFGIVNDNGFDWVLDALSNLLGRLCRLPRLKEVNFDTADGGWVNLFRIKSLGLPSTVKFNRSFRIKLPGDCRGNRYRSRLFEVTKCNTQGTLGRLVHPSPPNLLRFEYLAQGDETNIISNGATLLQLESLSERLNECTCFEQVVHTTAFTLHRLQVNVDLSQTEDLFDCLRILLKLQVLELDIRMGDGKITRDYTLSDTARIDLRRFTLVLSGGVQYLVEAQKPLGDLLSALGILYPGVKEVHLRGRAWMSIEASYLRNLQALKSLRLLFEDSPVAQSSTNLQSAQFLEMEGVARLDILYTPNLLKLVLRLGRDGTKLDHLGAFPPGLRSLAITLNSDMKDFNLTSLDCPGLQDLYLASWARRASWGGPRLSNLVSIKVTSHLETPIDASSNQMCITLLCYPWRLPSLRELHFAKCVEWDVLFLMLKRRNCDKSGVQRIDTVALPFVPFPYHKLLVRLLAGEIVELPSLTSLSLEATREVIFDSSVPGCFACMKNMRPGCTARVVSGGKRNVVPVDILYPPEDSVLDEVPQEVQDWLSQRWGLVEMWKASYEEFSFNFVRESICATFPRAPL